MIKAGGEFIMEINTKELIKLLPEGYRQACYETKAIERKPTVQTPEFVYGLYDPSGLLVSFFMSMISYRYIFSFSLWTDAIIVQRL